MKYIFLSLALVFTCGLSAQKVDRGGSGDGKATLPDEIHDYRAAAGAYYFLPIASLNAHMMDMGATKGFTNAIGVGYDRGLNYKTPELDNYFTFLLSFHYLLPQTVSADSSTFNLNGYNAQFDLFALNYLNSDVYTLTGGISWAFGRLKVTEDDLGLKTTFTNAYFAPELRLELNACLWEHFYIGVRGAYRHDWTSTAWKRSGSADDLPGTRLSGTMAGAFIGWGK